MTQVCVAEAARLVGRDRKSIYRAIKQGRVSATLSPTGERQIDTAELIRIYGELRDTATGRGAVATPQRETPNEAERIAALEAENASLKARLNDKERHIDDLRGALRMLEHKQEKKPWWRW